ncbi:MAG: hypothetical protein ACRD19_14735 [Terriglobia bacterium]
MRCNRCGAILAESSAFCGTCGAPSNEPEPRESAAEAGTPETAVGANPDGAATNRSEIILRVACGILLFGGIAFLLLVQGGGELFLLLAPALVGLFLPLLQLPALTATTEGWEGDLIRSRKRAQEADGKFARFVRRPFYACATGIWKASRSINNPHIRAAVRVALSLYLVALFLMFIVVATYVIIVVVFLLVAIAIIGWVLSLNNKSRGTVIGRRQVDWSGREKLVYRDASGKKTGESRERVGIFGDRRTEHVDTQGRKVGESRSQTGIFGDQKTTNYAQDGAKVGESREATGIIGDPKTIHYDNEGRKTGESRPTKDILGSDVIEHFDEKGDKNGETQ